jgi:DNA modification methylase
MVIKKAKNKQENTKVTEFIKEAEKEISQKEEEVNVEIPQQAEFFKTPVRFGNIPVDKLPLGCDVKEQYRKIYPKILLPFQVVERVSFGHKNLEPNQLLFGDNLHIMRALPSNSIDLIYIDPPFFSGRNYNVIFGDSNEVRSFTDIWEGGMPGYLIWLNARLLEMKRLLKPTGTIFVHCDYHASHYIKIEMDKIFGYEKFRNELIWIYEGREAKAPSQFNRKHDVILYYTKSKESTFNYKQILTPLKETSRKALSRYQDEDGKYFILRYKVGGGFAPINKEGKDTYRQYVPEGVTPRDWFFVDYSRKSERIGYPTQKPEELLEKLIKVATNKGDVVADFFCGGGTTSAVAQKLERRWITSDISKVAVSVTRDRILKDVIGKNGEARDNKEIQQSLGKVPDIMIANWGVYEVPEIVKMKEDTFRNFIISAYNGRLTSSEGLIHGYKQAIPLYIGSPSQEESITEKQVIEFAKDIVKRRGHHQGIMIAWGFTPGARNVAQQLAAQHAVAIDFVKLQLIPIESDEFKEHITSKHTEYKNLLKFILPPEVRISTKRKNSLEYEFDVSESVSLNPSGRIINVAWDFSYNSERFISTSGYSFLGMKDNKPILKVDYKFSSVGKKKIACKVQDDEGGEKIEVMELDIK